MNEDNPTHLLAIEYIAKLERENAALKLKIEALLRILTDSLPQGR